MKTSYDEWLNSRTSCPDEVTYYRWLALWRYVEGLTYNSEPPRTTAEVMDTICSTLKKEP